MTRPADARPRFYTSGQRGISGVLVGGIAIIVAIIIIAGVCYAILPEDGNSAHFLN